MAYKSRFFQGRQGGSSASSESGRSYRSKFFQSGRQAQAAGASGLREAVTRAAETTEAWERALPSQTIPAAQDVKPRTRVDTPITQAARAGLQKGTLPIADKTAETFLAPKSTLRDADELRAETLHRSNPAVSLPAQTKSVLRDVDGVTSLPTGAEHTREHASSMALERLLEEQAEHNRALSKSRRERDFSRTAELQKETPLLNDRLMAAYEGAYDEGRRTAAQRVGYGASSVVQSAEAAFPVLADTAKQYISNNEQQSSDPRRAELAEQIAKLGGQIDYLERYKYPTRYAARQSEEWKALDTERTKLREALAALDVNTPVSMDAPGMQKMTGAIEMREKALEGTEGVPRFLGETAISIGQNLALLPTAAISPAVPLAAMGTIAAADKTYELNARGAAPGEALARGLVSGGIEAATEKIPLDSLLDLVQTGGRSAVRSLLRQMGVEATEEAVSYVLNYAADEAARDPEAEFSLQELAEAALGGGISGGVLGGGAMLLNRAAGGNPTQTAQEAQGTANTQTGPTDIPPAPQTQKTASTGEAGVKGYQKAEHHGDILDTVRANLGKVSKIKPVAALTGQEFQKTAGDSRNLRTKVIDFFNSLGNKVTRKDLGDIELNTSGVRDSLAHGYGKLKAATFAALPQVLEQGELIAHNGPYEGHWYDSYVISAPVRVGNETVYVGALVIKDTKQRYKLHEVLTTNESGASLFQSESTSQGADVPLRNDTPLGASVDAPTTAPILAENAPGVNTQSAQAELLAYAGRALGESGARALETAYTAGTDPAAYYAGFAAYYNAGLSGRKQSGVRSEAASKLTEAQRYAAYTAGQNDAAASLRREKRAAAFAPAAGTGSGLVYDAFVRQAVESGRIRTDVNGETRAYLTADTAAKINRVAKALGVRVQFVDSITANGQADAANARIAGAGVEIQKDNPNPVMFLIGHEMTHRIQELAPEAYRAFRSAAAEDAAVQAAVERQMERHAARGLALSYEAALDEAAADYAGRLIDDGKVLDEFIEKHRDDRTLLEKVRDAIRAILDKLTGAERKRAQTAEGKLTAALEAAAKQARRLQTGRSGAIMDAEMHAWKEGAEYGQNGGMAQGTGKEEIFAGRRSGSGEVRDQAGGSGILRLNERYDGVDPSFGSAPRHAWADGAVVAPAEGSVTHDAQRTAVKYGVPSFVVSDEVWERNRGKHAAPAFSIDGQVYFKETAPERVRGMLAPHELTHVMRQRHYQPYLDFIERTPDMLNIGDVYTQKLFQSVAEHQGIALSEADPVRLFDEFNAAMYGHIAAGKAEMFRSGEGAHVFHDFAAYAAELKAIHEQFQRESRGDGRFSLKEDTVSKSYAAVLEENDLLRERVAYWKGQTRQTAAPGAVDKKAVEKAARDLIRRYGAELEAAELAKDLKGLYDYLGTGKDGKNELTYTEARRRAVEAGRKLVESAVEAEDGLYREYAALRQALRERKLYVPEEVRAGLARAGGWNEFRKANMGRLSLSATEGAGIDQVYQALAEDYPEFFDEARTADPADQLIEFSEVLGELYRVEEVNPFGGDLEQAAEDAANEIMELFFDLPQVKKTFADRQAQKLDAAKARGKQQAQRAREQRDARLAELRAENRSRVEKTIRRERETRARQLQGLKDRYAARDAAGRERRSAAELRRKITRHAQALSQKLLHPSDKQHIPEELRGAVAAMLEAINLESQYSIDPDTGKRAKSADGLPAKRTEAFRALKEQYEAISKGRTDFNGVLDPDLLENLGEAAAMKDTRLADMSAEQLRTVWQTVRAIEQSVSTANKLLGESRFAGVLELAEDIRQSSATKRTKGSWRGPVGWGDKLLNLDMLNSLTFLHLFGEGGDALYHELQKARDNKTVILYETVNQAKRAVGKADVEALQKKTHTFQTEGGELKLTTAQLMALYELNKRKQAQDHIYKGGIRAAAQDSGVSRSKTTGENLAAALGKVDAPAAGVKVSQADVAAMLAELTGEEIKIADGLQSIMQGYLAQEGNRESMKVYGYQKFTEKDYFPISSDPHQVVDKIGDVLESGEKRPRSIAEWGSAKGTVAKANNGILLGDIFDVFAQHAVDMATYASHLGVMEDMNRVRNFTFRDGEGNRTGAMGDIIQRVAGQGGGAYLDKLLQDASAGTAKGGVSGLGKLTANYKAASVGLNLRVALQQPTSYLRAAAAISPKYLADPRVLKKGGWEKALKNAPIARWKDWGNFEINQGRQLQDVMFNTDSKLDRARNFSMKLAGAMDSLTWGRIWNACELEVSEKRPDLARGGAAFYEAVAQRFTDVVDQTQVVDNVLGRSQIMRSGDNLSKMATSYMGEPTQSYNLVYRALRDWAQEQDNAKRTAAKKRLGCAVVALTASQFANAIAQALWDAVRDDDDRDEKYWERVLGHIMPNFEDNANPIGMVPYLKDIVSVLQGYDVKRMDMAAITSFISACQNMSKAINGEGRYTLAGASANLMAEAGRIFGLPAATVKRDLVAIARSVGVETGDWYFQYQLEKALNSVGCSGNRGEFYDIAFGALKDGELDVYQRIAQDLAARGVKSGAIENAMRDRLKKALEEDPDFSMPQQARDLIAARESYSVPEDEDDEGGFTAAKLGPAAYQRYAAQRADSYRDIADAMERFDTFRGLDNETKNKALDAAYTLAKDLALRDHSGGQFTDADLDRWERWATQGGDYGVDETEAILFKTAYDMAESDKDRNGKTISGSRKENTLEAAARLMPWLTGGELDYLMSGFWTPEDQDLKALRDRGFLG